MRRGDLFRSSGFRLAALYTALFLLAAVMAGATAFLVISRELVFRHERAVERDYRFLEGTYQQGGRATLIETARTQASAAHSDDKVLLLMDANGEKLAGNIEPVDGLPGSGEVSAARLGLSGDYDYYMLGRTLDGIKIYVGSSGEDVSEVEEVFYQGAVWAGLLLVVISLSGGLALAVRMNGRLSDVKRSLAAVAGGDFSVRMPRSGRGDDIDRLMDLIDDAVARLGTAVETNRQITTDIAHDLKTPMNRLRIEVGEALERSDRGQPVDRQLAAVDRESASILATFDALLRIAQLETGARKARFRSVDLCALLRDVVELYEASADERGATLEFVDPGLAMETAGDRDLLAQLFTNLVENALKHGGDHPTISVAAVRTGDRVAVTIRDDGPGIPEVERDKVFRRLYRLEKSRTTQGSGLGLSLVKAIVDLHDARITLDDANPGLAVTIDFPGSRT